MSRSDRIMTGIWDAVREKLKPELLRYRARYPASRRRALLEALAEAAVREDEAAFSEAGLEYLRLTRTVPPGAYAVCVTRSPSHYLEGERVRRRSGEEWTVYRFSPQVWR